MKAQFIQNTYLLLCRAVPIKHEIFLLAFSFRLDSFVIRATEYDAGLLARSQSHAMIEHMLNETLQIYNCNPYTATTTMMMRRKKRRINDKMNGDINKN